MLSSSYALKQKMAAINGSGMYAELLLKYLLLPDDSIHLDNSIAFSILLLLTSLVSLCQCNVFPEHYKFTTCIFCENHD